ncbi:ATP-binding protein [Dolichospermum heterosporum]|uniref:AAA family ATPase n=1 Tax=Dolichospermum heterosporum TAC447 TaxID=747523 RepID=A0ABY5LYC8_9CYAN|nr:ATP-binding protein [Dolichospermum heterosporum]UUO15660.1 AAA family ATPase [Dolichospermum heterosporum TAC447]
MITFSKPQRNPYIVGRPVDQPLLFGRESLFSSIKDDLEHNRNIILLHGQRRIGKSSVIRNIPSQLSDLNEFVFVTFNLEYYSQESLSRILAELAKEIISDLSLDDKNINLPEITELELEPEIFYNKFLPQVYQALNNKRLVFLIDEFDALLNSNNPELLKQVYQYYESLIINFRKKLFLILLIEQKSINNRRISKIFNKDVSRRKIGLLDENSTKNLIIKPAENILEYKEDAIEAIFNLSAGHPYLIQAICFTIFGRARENDHWKVNKEDVEAIINKAIEISEAGLAWFWDGFSIPEKIVFAAIAEAQESSENYVALIKRFRPDTEDKQIIQMEQFLRSNGFLDEIEQKVKIELVRRWIIQRHPLREEISELDKIEQKKNQIDIELQEENIVNGDNNQIVISDIRDQSIPNARTTVEKTTSVKSNLIFLAAIGTIVTIILAVLVTFVSRSCLPGQQKQFGISCVPQENNNISRGDHTLFPNINNTSRDQGIEAFKKGDYQQAAELFKKAGENNKDDPEVLIYYNNSLARQQGSPRTLGVVVPIDKNTSDAQEILRGVAQAQDQFNRNFKGRLVEIVIANDSNTEQAKQVAQELVKDTSILGIIGHDSSDATEVALPEYAEAGLKIIFPTSPTKTSTINYAYHATQDFIKALSSSNNPTRATVLEKLKK